MAARVYEFYLRVLKVSLTSERSEAKRPCNVLFISQILMKFPHKRQLILFIFETAKSGHRSIAIQLITNYDCKMPVTKVL